MIWAPLLGKKALIKSCSLLLLHRSSFRFPQADWEARHAAHWCRHKNYTTGLQNYGSNRLPLLGLRLYPVQKELNDTIDTFPAVPAGSPSRGGGVGVYVEDINQLSLPTPFYSVLMSFSVFMVLSTVFHSIKSPADNSPLSRSVLPVLFLPYWSSHLYFCLSKPPSALTLSFVVDKADSTN